MTKNEMAICIDFWSDPSKKTPDWVVNTVKFIQERQEIDTVVLATYDIGLEAENRDDLDWYTNREIVFNNDLPVPIKWTHKKHQAAVRFTPWHPWVSPKETYKYMLLADFPGKYKIAMHWWYQLEWYLKQNPHIDTIWIFGCGFNKCCRTRELGWQHGPKLTGLKWFTNADCACDPDWLNRLDNWVHSHDTIYKHVFYRDA